MILNEKNTCRVCGSNVTLVSDFGEICINDFPKEATNVIGQAPMVLDQCENCDLVQLRHTVDPKILYGEHYWYESALNEKLKNNLLDIASYANKLSNPGDTVIDIGANDGTLLSGIKNNRYKIGCEPAPNLWEKLVSECDVMIPKMWDHKFIKGQKAKVITAIGMFYDMDNPNEFIHSVRECLDDNGIFIAQLMTLVPMLRMRDLGNICHEHLEYYSYKSLVKLYEQNGLEIFDVIENDIQGGSYQLWAKPLNEGSIDYPEDLSLLHEFFAQIKKNGELLKAVLSDFIKQGKKCYVYGASTKGNTMLQIWNLSKYFQGAAEIHPGKIGRFTVGTGIPIIHEDDARKNADVFFVPNFGFKDMFVEKEKEWINNGGAMVFAMPDVNVVNKIK